jgi:hypothetical protein
MNFFFLLFLYDRIITEVVIVNPVRNVIIRNELASGFNHISIFVLSNVISFVNVLLLVS